VGFAVGPGFYLDQARRWKSPVLAHPLLHSFMHRTLVLRYIAGAAMVAISPAFQPQDPAKAARNVFTGVNCSLGGQGETSVVLPTRYSCALCCCGFRSDRKMKKLRVVVAEGRA
jgi:hypothetical protein